MKIFLILILSVLLISPISANIIGDQETILPCIGDEETTFLCGFGDDENAFYNFEPIPTRYKGIDVLAEEKQPKISKSKVFLFSGILIVIFFILLLIIFIKKNND